MAGIVDFIKDTQKKFQFLKWVQIIPQESLATKKSALYFVEKNNTEVDAIVIDDLGQKRKLTGGGTTGIQSIQEGDNVSIDNTDPLNPIVSATGGGTTGDYIPLSGTEAGKPVTGDIELDYSNITIGNIEGKIEFDSGTGIKFREGLDYIFVSFGYADNQILINSYNGISSSKKFLRYNTNEESIFYAQMGDIYDANSYFTTEYKTGGKWIDNKDIYKITQLTADPAPTVDTMIKSTVVGGTYTEYEYTKLAE